MKAALWFLVKFLFLGLFIAIAYWLAAASINRAFVASGNFLYTYVIEDHFQFATPPQKPTSVRVEIPRENNTPLLFVQLDGLPFHFNIVPLLALFLATPGVRLPRKVLHVLFVSCIAWLTYMLHLYVQIEEVKLKGAEMSIYQDTFQVWLRTTLEYFRLQTIRNFSIFMKLSGSLAIPFLLWILFYFRDMRIVFFPQEMNREYIAKAHRIDVAMKSAAE